MISNITSVKGIKCWGAHTGLKSLRRDLALIYSEKPATVAAVFTQNKVVAEPVKLTQKHVLNGKAQVVVCNSGNANACTGKQGADGAMAMAKATAEEYNVPIESVIVASTGIIGQKFPTEEVVKGIHENANKVSANQRAGSFAANAILTTDTFAKEGYLTFKLGGKDVTMAGIAKGSGMIHPNMGTMLAFIFTDADIAHGPLNKAFKEAIDSSFNMITVDGDTSTNDMASVMANGMAENPTITDTDSEDYGVFAEKLQEICTYLAKLIVSDGEGATKFIEYRVSGATDVGAARRLIRTISDSSLVKTAMFGRDPNWGRILAAAGRSGVPFDPDKVDLYLGSNELFQFVENGLPLEHDVNLIKKQLRESEIKIHLDLNMGNAEAIGWGTDLSTDYVVFNSVYTT